MSVANAKLNSLKEMENQMHGNSRIAIAMRLVDLQKWLRDTPKGSQQALWYQTEIAKLTKRLYR